jgi:hypothetical protein
MVALAAAMCDALADLAENVPEIARSVLKGRQGKNSIKTRGLVRASFFISRGNRLRMTKGWPIFQKTRSPVWLDSAGRGITQVSDNTGLALAVHLSANPWTMRSFQWMMELAILQTYVVAEKMA